MLPCLPRGVRNMFRPLWLYLGFCVGSGSLELAYFSWTFQGQVSWMTTIHNLRGGLLFGE